MDLASRWIRLGGRWDEGGRREWKHEEEEKEGYFGLFAAHLIPHWLKMDGSGTKGTKRSFSVAQKEDTVFNGILGKQQTLDDKLKNFS